MPKEQISRRTFLRNTTVVVTAATAAQNFSLPQSSYAAASPGGLSFGVQTPPQNVSYSQVQEVWLEADALGFDSAFVFDHFMPIFSDPNGPCFEGWTLLAALAAQTKRMRVGLLVTGNTYRNPVVLAKMAATVDHVSGGRLILGMGAGWFELEHHAYGIPYHTPGGRARRLVEAVELIKMLFTQDKTTYDGKYYQIKDASFEPKPLQKPHPPILIGGMGPRVVQPLVARHANIWHFFVSKGGAEAIKGIATRFDAICKEVGRDPAEIQKSTSLRPAQLNQSPDKVQALIQAYADAGVQYFIVSMFPDYDRDVLRRFAKEVMPVFREA